jgi:hypothetical protein
MNKKCFKCEKVLSLDQFYKHSEMADGHLNKCIECTKADAMFHRRNNVQHCRKYDRQRDKLPHRIELKTSYLRKQRMTNPEKSNARQNAERALADGRLKKEPCHFCGSNENIEMHHPDYSQALRVYWLCLTCHRKLDNMQKIGISPNI